VVRDLLAGPKRFTELHEGLPGIPTNVLTSRLRELEDSGIVQRRVQTRPADGVVYELTDWGYELEPVLQALGRWGSRSPTMPHDGELGISSFVLAMRTMFSPEAAKGLRATYQLRLGEQPFAAKVSRGSFEIEPGEVKEPDATIHAPAHMNLVDVVFNGRSLGDALEAGDIRIDGDRKAAERYVNLFPLPDEVDPDEIAATGDPVAVS